MKALLPMLALASAVSCAPLPTRVAAPTQLTTSVTYTTGAIAPGADNPVLTAVVALAPTAPVTDRGRQPWRAEEIDRNRVTIRSRPTVVDVSSFSLRSFPQEMTFTVISTGTTTTLNGTYSSAYAATAEFIFDGVGKRFPRVPAGLK